MLQAFHLEISPGRRAEADSSLAVLNGPLKENMGRFFVESGAIRIAIWHFSGEARDHVFAVIEATDPQVVLQGLFHPHPDVPVMEWSREKARAFTDFGEHTELVEPLFLWQSPD